MAFENRLFEGIFFAGRSLLCRYYDTNTGKSNSYEVKSEFEYFVNSDSGYFKPFVPREGYNALKKQLGRKQEASGLYGECHSSKTHIRDNYWFPESSGRSSKYNTNPRVWWLDIETRSGTVSTGFPTPEQAAEPICCIQIYDTIQDEIYILALKDLHNIKRVLSFGGKSKVRYFKCDNEIDLIDKYFKLFKYLDPLIISAANGSRFDFPYIYNRVDRLNLNHSMSNYGKSKIEFKSVMVNNMVQEYYEVDAIGHYYIDFIDLYKKFVSEPRESYRVDYLAEVELGENKVSHDEYVKFDHFYTGDYTIPRNPTEEQKNSEIYKAAVAGDIELVRKLSFDEFICYAIKDVTILRDINNKLSLITLIVGISQIMGTNINEALKTVSPWTTFIRNKSYDINLVLPPKRNITQRDEIVGGFVRTPQLGKHRWVLSGDVASMYPILAMVGHNMSPETYVPMDKVPEDLRTLLLKHYNDQNEDRIIALPDEIKDEVSALLRKYNYSMGINGAIFDLTNIGLIPQMILEFYGSRKRKKGKQFVSEQSKIAIHELESMGISEDNAFEVIKKYIESKSLEFKFKREEIEEQIQKHGINAELNRLYDFYDSEERRWNAAQISDKTIINSLYGAFSNIAFPLFNIEIARAITGNGRYFIKSVGNEIEKQLQALKKRDNPYIIGGDTDSIYYTIDLFVDEYAKENNLDEKNLDDLQKLVDFADEFEKNVVQKFIQKAINRFAEELNTYKPEMIMVEREVISDVMIIAVKKKYMTRVLDKEGTRYEKGKPKIKIMGLELAKSSTSKFTKKHLYDIALACFDCSEEELRKLVREKKKLFMENDPIDMASHKAVNGLDYELGDKGIPIGARSTLSYNKYITDNNLTDVFSLIHAGDKCNHLYLSMPNELNTNSVYFIEDSFVEELKKLDCIDYDTTYQKFFVSALNNMVSCMGYNLTVETESLEDFW